MLPLWLHLNSHSPQEYMRAPILPHPLPAPVVFLKVAIQMGVR